METNQKRAPKDYALLTLKGMAMGAADVVPGVSGGTIAFITGIYEEFLDTLSRFDTKAIKLLFKEGIIKFWNHVNGTFLVALFTGIIISFLSLAKLASYLLVHNPIELWAFFFGLVAASIIYVGKQVEKWRVTTVIGFIVGTAIAYTVTVLPPLAASESQIFLFFSGMIAICAMILPGVSGSFILLLLGAYGTMMNAFHELDVVKIGIFAAGAIAGLLAFSKFLKWVFKSYKDVTIATLAGFLLGSLNKLWPWKHVKKIYVKHAGEPDEEVVNLLEANVMPAKYDLIKDRVGDEILTYAPADPKTWWAIGLFVIGFSIIFAMEFFAKKLKKDEQK